MLEMLHEISQLERYKQYDQLVDFQQVEDYSLTPQGLSEYARRASALATVHHASIERKIAIVVGRDLQFGMGRMFIAQMDGSLNKEIFSVPVKKPPTGWV